MTVAVIAPDKFKGSLTAGQAATAIERGLRSALDELDVRPVPMADGGEGTVEAFLASGARRIVRRVRGPLGEPIDAAFALEGETAILEMSAASGLQLTAATKRDPLHASTYGTGELVRAALDEGARRVVVGLGGSATNDGGAGMLRALGVRFYDTPDGELAPGGAALARLARIDLTHLDPRLANVRIEVAADVDNPLTGPRGASAVFGAQKGADADAIALLESALEHFAGVAARTLGRDERDAPGAGAAGGLGFGFIAFARATLRPGVEIVAELRGLERALQGAHWCLTGEGSIDMQTLGGKTVDGVARIARAAGVPTIAFGGRVEAAAEEALAARGVAVVPIVDAPIELADALSRAAELLERAAARAGRLLAPAR
ncbi:MAG TPA: glycerate kinase [Candidatus Baltobacteraceae bacterium]|nr:glycerate kinase [Candidatus Baltobacteraceae bacterium]